MSADESTIARRPLPPLPTRRRAVRIVHSPDRAAIGRAIALADEIVLGRTVEGEGRIQDRHMSREHARIVRRGPSHFVEDLGTENGSFLSGKRVESGSMLAPNDVLAIGETLLVVDQDPNPDDLPGTGGDAKEAHEIIGVSFGAERL